MNTDQFKKFYIHEHKGQTFIREVFLQKVFDVWHNNVNEWQAKIILPIEIATSWQNKYQHGYYTEVCVQWFEFYSSVSDCVSFLKQRIFDNYIQKHLLFAKECGIELTTTETVYNTIIDWECCCDGCIAVRFEKLGIAKFSLDKEIEKVLSKVKIIFLK